MKLTPRLAFFVLSLLLHSVAAWCQDADSRAQQQQVLARHGVGSDVDDLLAFLRQLQPDPTQRQRHAKLVEQLGDDRFRTREQAVAELERAGQSVRTQLIEAAGSYNVEVRWRARRLLAILNTDQQRQTRNELVLSALVLLKSHASELSVGPLIDTIPFLDEPYLRNAACEAIWASTTSHHAGQMRQALAHKSTGVRVAAIVGLELAIHDAAIELILPYMKNDDERIRLAVARALADQRPRESARLLIDLLDSRDYEIRWQSARLLELITGRADDGADESLAGRWREWADQQLAAAKLSVTLGPRRLVLNQQRTVVESFLVDAKEITSRYGRFQYQSQVGSHASVSDGILKIHGDRAGDGDQSLAMTAQQMFNRRELPERFSIETSIGGQSLSPGAWHVGVAVGQLRFLFHPDYSGGAFRVERIGSRDELVGNTNMGFTPTGDVLHRMTIDVKQKADRIDYHVTIVNGQDKSGATKYTMEFTAPRSVAGKLDRIALERSGRQGGAALFGFLKVSAN